MHQDVIAFNRNQNPAEQKICEKLATSISELMPEAENKIWQEKEN
jgi:hypothetical protein